MSQNQNQSIIQQQQQTTPESNIQQKVSDGQVRCVLCLKKHSLTSCKQCSRCNQITCKSCFKVDSKAVTPTQKKLFNSNSIGKCCFSDLIYQQNILSDTTIQWGKDSVTSQNWCSNDHKQDYTFIDPKLESDDSFELCVEYSNTKYKEHLEMKIIEKEIFEDDIYSRKNMNKSFGEFLNTVQNEISSDKVKQDQLMLLKAFISYLLSNKETPEDKLYMRGHGMLALFLLCFCSIKKAFYVMKEIYHFYYVDILHPDQIKKESNYCSIVKHIVFIYLENFQKKKDPSAQLIEKIVAFTRKYLYFQYNFFFLNQLNLSSAFQIIEQLFLTRSHETMTRAMTCIINLNIKMITEGDLDTINMKDIIYNKVQPDCIYPLLLQQWAPLRREAIYKILEEHRRQCEMEKYKKYDCGAKELEYAVKTCIKKQKNQYKIMEEHFMKEIKDLKSALKLAMDELRLNAEQMHRMEVEKNNIIVQYQALKKKYEINEIEYEDIQVKLQFLNERASKRQMHYNKEYEAQVANLQQQVKNQKLDFIELEMLYKNQYSSFKQQLDDKDNIIKRLKQGVQLLQRQRNEVVRDKGSEQSLQEVYEICKNPQEQDNQQNPSDGSENDESSNIRMFHSYFQPKIQQQQTQPLKKFERNNHLLQHTPDIRSPVSSQNSIHSEQTGIATPKLQGKQSYDEKICDEIEDEREFYAVTGDMSIVKAELEKKQIKNEQQLQQNIQNKSTPDELKLKKVESTNNELSKSVLMMYKSLEDPQTLQQAINEMQTSPTSTVYSAKSIKFEQTDEKQFISSLEHPYFLQDKAENNNNSNFTSPNQLPQVSSFSPSQQFQSSHFKSPSQYNTTQALTHIQPGSKSASPHPHFQNQSHHHQAQLNKPLSSINLQQSQINNLFGTNIPIKTSPNTNNSNYTSPNQETGKQQFSRQNNQRAMTQVDTSANKQNDVNANGQSNEKQQNNKRTLSNSLYTTKEEFK